MADYGNMDSREDLLVEMMNLRAEFAFNHAIKGFGLDFDTAMELLRNHNDDLTQLEKDQRDVLLAALDNLVDFAVAQEFQMSEDVEDISEEFDPDDPKYLEECYGICERYNNTYANVENGDIEYALGIAAAWIRISGDTVLTYMTQGDERVRPWHLALEGLSYRKYEFPDWLIPPIEHACRCYLVEESADIFNKAGVQDVEAKKIIDMPDFVNPVFRESVAKCGRIFSSAHSYFKVPKKEKKRLKTIAQKIKDKWLK